MYANINLIRILNYYKQLQSKMSLSGKIASLIHQNHFVSVNDLRKFATQEQIRVAFLEYGRNYYNRVVCSLMAIKKSSQGIIAGTFILSDILNMQKSNDFQIKSILPLGAFDQNYQLDEFLSKICIEPTPKKGDIIPRKVKTRLIHKQNNKMMIKKQSQTQNNGNKAELTKNLSNKSLNKQNKIQKLGEMKQKPKLKLQQEAKRQQVKKDTYPINFMNKKITKSQAQSEDEAKILQKYTIKSENQQKKAKSQQNVLQIERYQAKQLEPKQQIAKKLSDLQLDEQQEYELILKKQKMKGQNKNINIIQKIEKKTTDRIVPSTSTTSKPKPTISLAQTTATRVGNQATLFKYINKK